MTAALEAARVLAERTGVEQHDIAVVLGSGWGHTADALGDPVGEVRAAELPGFPGDNAPGHAGRVRSVVIGDRRVLLFLGRPHLYQGHGVEAVAMPARLAAAAGCRTIVLTNGAGGLRPEWEPGTLALISDHINLTGATPLQGAEFVNLVDAYSPALRAHARSVEPSLVEGVYVQVRGPQFETPAEIRMMATMGADLVGMSTALDTIAARAAGLEVLGLSLVTNFAAGLTGAPITEEEVLATGDASAERAGSLLARLLPTL